MNFAQEKQGASRFTGFGVVVLIHVVAIYALASGLAKDEVERMVKDAQAHSDFQDAMHFWEQIVGKQLFDYRGDWNGQVYSGGDSISQNSLFAQSPWSYASNIAAQTIVLSQSSQIQGAVIMVNPNTSFCGGDCTGQRSSTSMRKVFAHELGHFIGLSHVQDTSNIMYPDALPGGSLRT